MQSSKNRAKGNFEIRKIELSGKLVRYHVFDTPRQTGTDDVIQEGGIHQLEIQRKSLDGACAHANIKGGIHALCLRMQST